jgi:hypothetical protein
MVKKAPVLNPKHIRVLKWLAAQPDKLHKPGELAKVILGPNPPFFLKKKVGFIGKGYIRTLMKFGYIEEMEPGLWQITDEGSKAAVLL